MLRDANISTFGELHGEDNCSSEEDYRSDVLDRNWYLGGVEKQSRQSDDDECFYAPLDDW